MMRHTMRWMSLVGGLSFAWALPALAEGTPVDCGSAECEGIRETQALYEAERNFLQETDRYSQNLAEVGFAPAACADGTRAPVPGPGWVAGCHFAYRVTELTGFPYNAFTAVAQGAAGTPAEGLKLQISAPWSSTDHKVLFWLERNGVRRSVGWEECLPAQSFTCSAQAREGTRLIRALYVTERAFLQEKDRYSSNFAEIGFAALGCTDGSRPPVPDSSWGAGCRFIYHVDVTGPLGFTATVKGVSGAVEGMTLKMDESGVLAITSVPFECQ